MSSLCPLCDYPAMKVIYFGLPGKLCANLSCSCLTGWAVWAPRVANEEGEFAFYIYKGSYWRALCNYVVGRVE